VSEGRLRAARRSGAESAVRRADLTQPPTFHDGAYPAVVSAGLFTRSLLGPDALSAVARIVAPGGLLVVGVNEQAYEADGYDLSVRDAIANRGGALLERRSAPYWPDKQIRADIVAVRL